MSRSYRFADCRVDPARRELWRAGQLVALPPQVFDFLAYLIERHDRAVGRDELVAAVWGKTEVSDTLLGQTVLRLRRELGDDAKEQRLLRTIPRFGYRWVAPLETSDDAVAPAEAAVASDDGLVVSTAVAAPVEVITPAPPVRSRRLLVAGLILAAVALVATWGVNVRKRVKLTPTPAPNAALTSAVLPAEVEPSAEWAWTRLGVMDMVATRLRTSGVPSVPSEEVVAFLNTPSANRSVGVREATSARLLISPQVHQMNGNWQISLDADDDSGHHYAVEAQAADIGRAARSATDKLLVALGTRPAGADSDMPYAEFIKRIDAAVLADDPDGARRLIEQASAEQRQSPELRLRLAKLDFRAGKLDAARERLVALLDEAPAKTAPLLRASILNGLGAVAIRGDQPQQADVHFGQAIELLGQQTDAEQLGQAYLGRAAAAADQHHFDAALADYARARIAYREANDPLALIRVAANEGFLDLDLDRPAQALPQLRAASEGFQQWGALNEAIFAYIGQINCHLDLLDATAALRAADAASVLAQRIDNPMTLASLTLARARVLIASGQLRAARAALDRLRSTSSDASAIAIAGALLARLELDAGNFAAAGELAERAVSTLAAPSYAKTRADAWLTQIRAIQIAGDAARADAAIVVFKSWAEQNAEQRALVYAQLARAEQALRFGTDKSWRADFELAQQLADRYAVPVEIAAVARSHVDALFMDRDMQEVAVEVGRVSRWAEHDFTCAVLEARLYAALGHDEARQAAVARARTLAGERALPADTLPLTIPAESAAAH